ncbi:MAG: thiamine phosphate synthase [bacterium]
MKGDRDRASADLFPADRLLYAIYPGPVEGPGDIEGCVRALCSAGAGMIQYREEHLGDGEALAVARRMVAAARPWPVPVVMNDRADLARLSGVHGVHLGQDDLPVGAARGLLEPGSVVGVSVDTAREAEEASAAGADYVSLGPAYPTTTKPDVPGPRSLDLYRELAEGLEVPLVAIGGIDEENLGPLIGAGVTAVAVISALYREDAVEGRARALVEAIRRARTSDREQGRP